jgi:hypothetical protein
VPFRAAARVSACTAPRNILTTNSISSNMTAFIEEDMSCRQSIQEDTTSEQELEDRGEELRVGPVSVKIY